MAQEGLRKALPTYLSSVPVRKIKMLTKPQVGLEDTWSFMRKVAVPGKLLE